MCQDSTLAHRLLFPHGIGTGVDTAAVVTWQHALTSVLPSVCLLLCLEHLGMSATLCYCLWHSPLDCSRLVRWLWPGHVYNRLTCHWSLLILCHLPSILITAFLGISPRVVYDWSMFFQYVSSFIFLKLTLFSLSSFKKWLSLVDIFSFSLVSVPLKLWYFLPPSTLGLSLPFTRLEACIRPSALLHASVGADCW